MNNRNIGTENAIKYTISGVEQQIKKNLCKQVSSNSDAVCSQISLFI